MSSMGEVSRAQMERGPEQLQQSSSGWTKRKGKGSCVQDGKADCAWCWWDRAHREEATAERIAERNLDLVLRKRERTG